MNNKFRILAEELLIQDKAKNTGVRRDGEAFQRRIEAKEPAINREVIV